MTLPNYFIIGAHKAGTTSLYEYLVQHPDVYMCDPKEPRYFSYDKEKKRQPHCPVQTFEAYQALFSDVRAESAIGEASVQYLRSDLACERIANIVPSARLIISLRNPIDRAYSDYQMAVRAGRETRPVKDAFGHDEPWVRQSLYFESIQHWRKRFPSGQIKIILFEDLVATPVSVTQSVYEFLGIDPLFVPNVSLVHNPGGVYKPGVMKWLGGLGHRNPRLKQATKYILPDYLRSLVIKKRNESLVKVDALPEDIRSSLEQYYANDILKLARDESMDLSRWNFGSFLE